MASRPSGLAGRTGSTRAPASGGATAGCSPPGRRVIDLAPVITTAPAKQYSPTSGPWSHLEMVLFTLGDDLNVHLDDPIVELACQEWVVANRDLLALPEGSLLPAGVGDGLATNGGSGSGVASADLLF